MSERPPTPNTRWDPTNEHIPDPIHRPTNYNVFSGNGRIYSHCLHINSKYANIHYVVENLFIQFRECTWARAVAFFCSGYVLQRTRCHHNHIKWICCRCTIDYKQKPVRETDNPNKRKKQRERSSNKFFRVKFAASSAWHTFWREFSLFLRVTRWFFCVCVGFRCDTNSGFVI